MNTEALDRRRFLKLTASAGAGIAAAGVNKNPASASETEKEVNANEDLMREHGALRRALLVYRAAVERLVGTPAKMSADALAKTASYFAHSARITTSASWRRDTFFRLYAR